ncbi:putative F-box protein At3g23260 [Morus notabilis]|nr:putative F-box protein At3g23260 [Morus notabilis]
MGKFSDLSEDIIIEIMSWLPPESLLQVKCVEKSWYNLINKLIKNPIFVVKHSNNSKKKKVTSLVIFTSYKGIRVGSLTIYNDEDNKSDLRCVEKDFEPLVRKHSGLFKYVIPTFVDVSHCNGIICFVDCLKKRFSLCNPATGESKLIPDPCFPKDLGKFGIGYDHIAKVYKVVRIVRYFRFFIAEVYTPGDDDWREIEFDREQITHRHSFSHVYCKGLYYWLSDKIRYKHNKIVMSSFDMHSEEFRSIRLPGILESKDYNPSAYGNSLTVWNESVVLFCFPRKEWLKTKPIEMWVMDQGHQISQSWTKHVSINTEGIDNFKFPTVFLNSEELLIQASHEGLFSYNIRTRQTKSIRKGEVKWYQTFDYVKSLVSIDGEYP